MPIQTACPNCDANYNLPDEKTGKTVRCKKCQKSFTVKANGAAPKKSKTSLADKVQAKAPAKAAASSKAPQRKVNLRSRDEDDDDDDDDDDKGKKKKKKGKDKNNSMMIWIGVGGGAALLGIIAVVWMLMSGGEETPTVKDGNRESEAKAKKERELKDKIEAEEKKKADEIKQKAEEAAIKREAVYVTLNAEHEASHEAIIRRLLVMTPEEVEKRRYPDLPEEDPIRKNYELLLKDRQTFAAEVKSAAEFFVKTDPQQYRDVNGIFYGFKDHPWRGKISKKLELLIDAEDYLKSKVYIDAYSCWAVPEDFDQMKLHLKQQGEHRAILLRRIAEFRTNPNAVQLIVDHLPLSEQALALNLIENLGGHLCLNPVFPYMWHPDYEIGRLAKSLVIGFDLPCNHELYQGPVETIPRVPDLSPRDQESMTLDLAIQILSTPANVKEGWRSETRFRQLRVMGWLQFRQLSEAHRDALSVALDKYVLLNDYPLRTNALICLERWGTNFNIATLKKCYDTEAGAMKVMSVAVLKRLDGAQIMLIGMWRFMDSTLQDTMGPYMLSFNDMPAKMALVKAYFNHPPEPAPLLPSTAREGATKWKIDREVLLEICEKDLRGPEFEVKMSALRWLKEQIAPVDEKFKKDYMKLLEDVELRAVSDEKAFAQFFLKLDPKTPPEVIAKKAKDRQDNLAVLGEVGTVHGKWKKETLDVLVKLLDKDPVNDPIFQKECSKAMEILATRIKIGFPPVAKDIVDRSIPAIAMRYQYPIDRNTVKTCLTRIGPDKVDPRLKEAFLGTEDKEKKIELLNVIGLVCVSQDVYDTIKAQLNITPPIDPDLATVVRAAMKNMQNRVDLK